MLKNQKKIVKAKEHMQQQNTTKTQLAKHLGIARQSLYYQPKRPAKNAQLKQQIVAVMTQHPAYGYRRVALALGMNKKPIRRVMKLFNLKPSIKRNHPFKPLDQNKASTTIPNHLARLCPIQPNVVWAGDFTYFWFQNQWYYLATVIDVYTREIVGWHISTHHTTALIKQALLDAIQHRKTTPQLFHSDQGSEYTSAAYLATLACYDIQPSHAQKGCPWQNGYQESFYSQFKLELGTLHRFSYRGQLIEAIHQQIHYYNTSRIHTAIHMAPQQFYLKQQLNKSTNYYLINAVDNSV